MKEAGLQERVLGRVAVTGNDKAAIGNWKEITKLSISHSFQGSDFLRRNISFKDIIEGIQQLPTGMTV